MMGRAVLERRTLQVEDFSAASASEFPESGARAKLHRVRAILVTPMLREGTVLGGISIRRVEPGPFSGSQIRLLETFADQAVIAIENVRLFNETKEALEQQTATAEILKVISSSPTDVQPVLDAVVSTAARLCDASDALISRLEGDHLWQTARYGADPIPGLQAGEGLPADRGSVTGRCVVDRQTVHVHDLAAVDEAEYPVGRAYQRRWGQRTVLATPLLREGRAIGAITFRRMDVRPFSDKHIKLLETFAAQAVIAIENVRLFKELEARNRDLTEALEQQTATAEILRATTRSPTDIQPVLDAIAENAARLCDAQDATVRLVEGDALRAVAHTGPIPMSEEIIPITPGMMMGRAVRERRTLQVEDFSAAAASEFPESVERAKLHRVRANLVTPMLWEGTVLGTIGIRRAQPGPFSDSQIRLLETFADQAVIAIENVRLFKELQARTREVELASRHKSEFLANMSHELRTPLNAVLGYTELIGDGIYGEVPAKIRDVMTRIDRSGRHLLGLINDVLDLAKIEAGQLTLSLADYSMQELVQTVFAAVESLAAEKRLALTVEVAAGLPPGRGDERRLSQVLLNLVGNALKFTEAGAVRIGAGLEDGQFLVSVADTGPGISPADRERIFEAFQQVDSSLTRKKGGTGLGLSIARRIVELHGGRLWVESEPGNGATFSFMIPVQVERQVTQ
jgi:signal transduction histidine kinase